MPHKKAIANMALFAREVMPRVKDAAPSAA